jgi:hypothetical protein
MYDNTALADKFQSWAKDRHRDCWSILFNRLEITTHVNGLATCFAWKTQWTTQPNIL